jgi:hypothetical protein
MLRPCFSFFFPFSFSSPPFVNNNLDRHCPESIRIVPGPTFEALAAGFKFNILVCLKIRPLDIILVIKQLLILRPRH